MLSLEKVCVLLFCVSFPKEKKNREKVQIIKQQTENRYIKQIIEKYSQKKFKNNKQQNINQNVCKYRKNFHGGTN